MPAPFKVIRQVRPKIRCGAAMRSCRRRARPADRTRPGRSGLLAHVLVSKYADHLPLYRQSAIYAREGVELDARHWPSGSAASVRYWIRWWRRSAACARAEKLHGDDTPVPVLEPGRGSTKTGRLWTYVRDDRPAGSEAPPAVLFPYSPNRKGEHPQRTWRPSPASCRPMAMPASMGCTTGRVDARGACWAHVRRKFYECRGTRLAAGAGGVAADRRAVCHRGGDPRAAPRCAAQRCARRGPVRCSMTCITGSGRH